jgi:alpha-D-xyloside xylohydrolase
MMKGLPMDFPNDPAVTNIGDQFMFGPALMVNPVTSSGVQKRSVYLPAAANWYDFRTDKLYRGGANVDLDAPYDEIPILVRAGSILPMGEETKFVDEKPSGPLEIRVYPGADAKFTLYEDQGDGYAYERGAYATIPVSWNDRLKELTIGRRTGAFPGMQSSRTIVVNVVGQPTSSRKLVYAGKRQIVSWATK